MAPQRRGPKRKQSSRQNVQKVPVKDRPEEEVISSGGSDWSESFISLLLFSAALASVYFEVTFHQDYTNSSQLLYATKIAYIATVCVTTYNKTASFFVPQHKDQQTILKIAVGHIQVMAIAVLANIAGSLTTQFCYGETLQIEDTVHVVVATYTSVQLLTGVLQIPVWVLDLICGVAVSWLKSVSIASTASRWNEDKHTHPAVFAVTSTANLFASGLVLKLVVQYKSSKRMRDLIYPSVVFNGVWEVVKVMCIASAVTGAAHIANHFYTQSEMKIEAEVLYFIVAFYALRKYWSPALQESLGANGEAQATKKTQ